MGDFAACAGTSIELVPGSAPHVIVCGGDVLNYAVVCETEITVSVLEYSSPRRTLV